MRRLPFVPVLLAGGEGARFWPLSRPGEPKQFLRLLGRRTLIEKTFARLRPLAPADRFLVVTSRRDAARVRRLLPSLARGAVLAEPLGRNTAAAVAWAVHAAESRDAAAVVGVFPADHHIADPSAFRRAVAHAVGLAAEPSTIVLLGVRPTFPVTSYGYLERRRGRARRGAFQVMRFHEKPDAAKAQAYLRTGRHYWNAGIFLGRADTIREALETYLPHTARVMRGTSPRIRNAYPGLPAVPFDPAVLEPACADPRRRFRVLAVPLDCGWSDVGNWRSLAELLGNRLGNAVVGNGLAVDCRDTLVVGWDGGPVVALGARRLVIVQVGGTVLVCDRDRAEEVRGLLGLLADR